MHRVLEVQATAGPQHRRIGRNAVGGGMKTRSSSRSASGATSSISSQAHTTVSTAVRLGARVIGRAAMQASASHDSVTAVADPGLRGAQSRRPGRRSTRSVRAIGKPHEVCQRVSRVGDAAPRRRPHGLQHSTPPSIRIRSGRIASQAAPAGVDRRGPDRHVRPASPTRAHCAATHSRQDIGRAQKLGNEPSCWAARTPRPACPPAPAGPSCITPMRVARVSASS